MPVMQPQALTPSCDHGDAEGGGAAWSLVGRSVLVVVNADGGGGVELLVDMLGGDLQRVGASVEVLFLYPGAAPSTAEKLRGIARAAGRILRSRPDVVMAFQPTSAALAGVCGRLAGTRHRVMHQSNMPLMTHWLPRLLDRAAGTLGFYTCNIANSAATVAAFKRYPASYRRRMRRIDHGIAYRPAERDRARVLAGIGVPDDQPILLSCARIVPQKSLHTIVEALPWLERGRFVVAGRGPDEERLTRTAAELGVLDRVHLIGHVDNDKLPELYAAADLFVFPSVWETFGLAPVEAAFQGLPIVASNLDTSIEVLAADPPGPTLLVPSWDAADWARAVRSMLDDPSVRPRAARYAIAMRERHGHERMLARYRELYRELIT